MCDIPKYITKYFNWEGNYSHFAAGSIRFGNLSEYRKAEEEMTHEARGDKKEGITELHSISRDTYMNMTEEGSKARSNYFKDLPTNVSIGGNRYTENINAWVFCATLGDYDADHHRRMMYGDDETGYKGNNSLDGWCVFDTYSLIRALKFGLRKHQNFKRHDYWAKNIYWREVSYDWTPRQFGNAVEELQAIFGGPKNLSDDEVVKRLTTKRELFSTEKEFRLIARIDERPCLPDNEPALLVAGPRIRSSIVRFGRMSEN